MSDKETAPCANCGRKAVDHFCVQGLNGEYYQPDVAVECTAPAPQLGRCPLCGSDKPDSFLGICAAYNEQNEPAHIFHWASTSDSHRAKMRGRAATPQVAPWKAHFTDSDVTGDIHNYVDTGDGKRLWAQDADEIVKRHNEGTSERKDKP